MKPEKQFNHKAIFSSIKKLKVFVIGDAMLDCYWMGAINRISPEAPVPIVQVTDKTEKLGGAANVALNSKALGAEVHLFTVLGTDMGGKKMLELLKQEGIIVDGCIQAKERMTTIKTRLMSKSQQVLRIDEEITQPLNTKDEHHFIDVCLRAIQIQEPDVIIFEDYNKGILLPNVIEKIISHAKHFNTLISVDPKKDHFFEYRHVDIFKPNLKEVRDALIGLTIEADKKSLIETHQQLLKKLHHQITLITLSEHGIFASDKNEKLLYPSIVRKIADVSGAGDTVIAVFTLVYRVTNNLAYATQSANIAAGLVCEEVGVTPINKQNLLTALNES